jgi:phosphate transport system permease protein
MMLNLARVAGETAPLLFTALDNRFWSPGLNQPTSTLPVVIYNYATSPYPEQHQLAWAAGFVLLTMVLLINITARTIVASGNMSKPR